MSGAASDADSGEDPGLVAEFITPILANNLQMPWSQARVTGSTSNLGTGYCLLLILLPGSFFLETSFLVSISRECLLLLHGVHVCRLRIAVGSHKSGLVTRGIRVAQRKTLLHSREIVVVTWQFVT